MLLKYFIKFKIGIITFLNNKVKEIKYYIRFYITLNNFKLIHLKIIFNKKYLNLFHNN